MNREFSSVKYLINKSLKFKKNYSFDNPSNKFINDS